MKVTEFSNCSVFQANVIHLTSYKNIGSISESQAEDENMVIEILHKITTYNNHYIDMEFSSQPFDLLSSGIFL